MPKHKPIKFETTLEPSLIRRVKEIMQENENAKTVFNATLALIAIGGVLTLGVMAPGVFGELTRMAYRRKKEKYDRYREVWQRFYLLKQKGNLDFVKEENGYSVYRLSKKGREKIKKFIFDEFFIRRPERWDGKWRLVIFDIPESQNKARWALRRKLKDLGFYQCQKSAWIHPFPCLEEIEFLKDILNIKPFVKLFLIEEMTDGKVLYHFRDQIKEVMTK
jgi:CRISPR/Cas system-associated endoribonuclease Cas2